MTGNSTKVVLFILFFTCSSCSEVKENTGGNFYKSSRDGDLYCIPLIEPYRIISTNGPGSDWMMELPYGSVKGKKTVEVKAVAVKDPFIIVYAELTYLPGGMTEAWFIVDTKGKTETVYKNASDYAQGVKEKTGSEDLPDLAEVNELYTQFEKGVQLPWNKSLEKNAIE